MCVLNLIINYGIYHNLTYKNITWNVPSSKSWNAFGCLHCVSDRSGSHNRKLCEMFRTNWLRFTRCRRWFSDQAEENLQPIQLVWRLVCDRRQAVFEQTKLDPEVQWLYPPRPSRWPLGTASPPDPRWWSSIERTALESCIDIVLYIRKGASRTLQIHRYLIYELTCCPATSLWSFSGQNLGKDEPALRRSCFRVRCMGTVPSGQLPCRRKRAGAPAVDELDGTWFQCHQSETISQKIYQK